MQITGEPLTKRADDNEEALKKRLASYHKETIPVIDYYRKRGIHTRIEADQPATLVWKNIRSTLASTGHFPRIETTVKSSKD